MKFFIYFFLMVEKSQVYAAGVFQWLLQWQKRQMSLQRADVGTMASSNERWIAHSVIINLRLFWAQTELLLSQGINVHESIEK